MAAKKAGRAAADLGVERVEIVDYFYAGTSRAMDHLSGDFSDVSCVCCGAKIAHVFMTNAGPMGGDCVATLTGDDSTRRVIRRTLDVVLNKARVHYAFNLRRNGCAVEGLLDSGWKTFAYAQDARIARMIGAAAAERLAAERESVVLFAEVD